MIIKVKNKPGFAQIQNTTLRDKRLSLEARGALGEILTYSEDFEASVKNLQKLWNIGREKLLRITNQLKEFGYLELTPVRDKRGRVVDWDWNFYGETQGINFRETAANKEAEAVLQNTENPHSGVDRDAAFTDIGENQHLENPHDLLKENSSQEEELKDLKTHTQSEERVSEILPVEIIPAVETIPEEIDSDADLPERNGNAAPPVADGYQIFTRSVWAYLAAKRLDTPFENPKWEAAIDYAHRREFSFEDFKATIEHLLTDPEEIKWRRGRLTAETVTNNLQKVWDIRAAQKQANQPLKTESAKCPDCDVRGMKEVELRGEKVMVKCRHEKAAQKASAAV